MNCVQKSGAASGSHRKQTDMTWAQMLLPKFPTFDPWWPDDVQAKWFAIFARLMGSGPPGLLPPEERE